ncbi:hypothetical protein O3M35_000257 [Rhynocoris fuscipes]|uniref:GPI transamidase component PIG-S n=1 Tax=Rhynocoris fuscipes TaxID=488301 RepID=A0AAW1DSE8_9HEMI
MVKNKEIESTTPTKMTLDSSNSDAHRMWAAVSFAVMLIVIGIPLWWKTTEVYRATLPYDEIHNLDPLSVKISMTVFVYSEYPIRTNSIMQRLELLLSDLRVFSISLKPLKIDLENVTYEIIEDTTSLHPNEGDFLLVEVPKFKSDIEILMSNKRIIYFHQDTSLDLLGSMIREVLQDNVLHNKMLSIVSPEVVSDNTKESNRLRASLSYDIVFTIINSDPEHLKVNWNIKNDIKRYIQPLFDQIYEASEHYVKSQWLYLIDIGEIGEYPNKKGSEWLLSHSQVPHIITPLEKKLGSGISLNPCVHMVLYITSCRMAPLSFVSENGEHLNAMISPHWGAVQILNPSTENCNNNTEIIPDSKYVMSVFTSQFHHLLRGRNELNISEVKVNKIKGPFLRTWELDGLFRMRTIEQITTATLTLQSLSKLLGEISNIVINEDVANSIKEAVLYVNKAKFSLKLGKLKEALLHSKTAFRASEKAFSDPTLLALLYFPDDQKYAVYIPLFLPIMIPVLMSLKKIHCWFFSIKSQTHDKQD